VKRMELYSLAMVPALGTYAAFIALTSFRHHLQLASFPQAMIAGQLMFNVVMGLFLLRVARSKP